MSTVTGSEHPDPVPDQVLTPLSARESLIQHLLANGHDRGWVETDRHLDALELAIRTSLEAENAGLRQVSETIAGDEHEVSCGHHARRWSGDAASGVWLCLDCSAALDPRRECSVCGRALDANEDREAFCHGTTGNLIAHQTYRLTAAGVVAAPVEDAK